MGDEIKCMASCGGNNKAGWESCQNKAYAYYKSNLTKSGKIALCRVHAKNSEMIGVIR